MESTENKAKKSSELKFGKYLVLDIETTDALQKVGQPTGKILQISAIIDDYREKKPFEELPKLDIIIKYNWSANPMTISPGAILMNKRIFELHEKENKILRNVNFKTDNPEYVKFAEENGFIVDGKITYENNVVYILQDFLHKNGLYYGITVCGKNFGSFDLQYLKTLPNWEKAKFSFSGRILDPAPFYFNPILDSQLPTLDECKKRAGISGKISHNALEDCWDTILVLRDALMYQEQLFMPAEVPTEQQY